MKQLEKQMQFRLRFEYDRLEQVTKEAIDAVSQLQAASKTAQLDLSPTVDKQVVDHVNKLLVGCVCAVLRVLRLFSNTFIRRIFLAWRIASLPVLSKL